MGKQTRRPTVLDPSARLPATHRFCFVAPPPRIRLKGIDAPEWKQTCTDPKGQAWSCGQAGAQELQSHIGGRELTCARHGVDRYNRILAVCSAPDGSDVNAWIVRQGWALASGD